jgi:hypothetical protein
MGFQAGNNEIQKRKRSRILLKIDLGMMADAAGVSKRTVQRATLKGKINMSDLKSVAKYITDKG